MKKMMTTREVAGFLGVNEKMVYSLIADKGLPASKVTGKWLFPVHLVEQWIENNSINYPETPNLLPPYKDVLIIAGSNDPLLDNTISLFNTTQSDQIAVFGNLGSLGGIQALRKELCHVASSHLVQDDGDEYNFEFADRELNRMPVVVNFCRREQGIVLPKGNPRKIKSIADFSRPGFRIVNRPLGTGTRLLLDREFKQAGIRGEKVEGYKTELSRHMDVGLEILAGRADAGPAIRPVASLLGLDFLPLRWERYDLLVTKVRFFDKAIQAFMGLLQEPEFQQMAAGIDGYDVSMSGKMVFQK
jgi:putative molybdopterin biosynthesis protein